MNKDEIAGLVLAEARLLDERRFAEWLGLFAEDAIYWVPTDPASLNPGESLALFHETRALLAMRVTRLERADMHVQAPAARTLHHVAAIEASGSQNGRWEFEARSSLILAERRAADTRWFAGRVFHGLRREQNALRIVLKRVDLIDSDAPQRALAVPF